MKLSEACATLGVEPGCSGDEAKKAFRKQALKWHPDKNGNSAESTAQFHRIQDAYQRLVEEEEEEEGGSHYYEYYDSGSGDDVDELWEDDEVYDFFFGMPRYDFFEAFFHSARFHNHRHRGRRGSRFNNPRHCYNSGYHHEGHTRRPEPSRYESETPAEREERQRRTRERAEELRQAELDRKKADADAAAERVAREAAQKQERGLRAWLRQTAKPAVSARWDRSLEVKIVNSKGLAVCELPATLMIQAEVRKRSDWSWSRTVEAGKGAKRVLVDGLEPGVEYLLRVRRFNRPGGGVKDELGEWSEDTRCATTGGEGELAAEAAGRASVRKGPRRPGGGGACQEAFSGVAAEMAEELLRAAREEQEERAAAKLCERGAPGGEAGEEAPGAEPVNKMSKKTKKKKAKAVGVGGAADQSVAAEAHRAAEAAPAAPDVPGGAGLQPDGLSEEEALARAIAESLAMQLREQEEELAALEAELRRRRKALAQEREAPLAIPIPIVCPSTRAQPQAPPDAPSFFQQGPAEPVVPKPARRAPENRAPGQPGRLSRAPLGPAEKPLAAAEGQHSAPAGVGALSARPRYMPPSIYKGCDGRSNQAGPALNDNLSAAPSIPTRAAKPPVPSPRVSNDEPLPHKHTGFGSNGRQLGPPCRFFNTKKGCRNGENCRFAHRHPSSDNKCSGLATRPCRQV